MEENPVGADHPDRSGTCSARSGALRDSIVDFESSWVKNCSDLHDGVVYPVVDLPVQTPEPAGVRPGVRLSRCG